MDAVNLYECQFCGQEFERGSDAMAHRREKNHLIRVKPEFRQNLSKIREEVENLLSE